MKAIVSSDLCEANAVCVRCCLDVFQLQDDDTLTSLLDEILETGQNRGQGCRVISGRRRELLPKTVRFEFILAAVGSQIRSTEEIHRCIDQIAQTLTDHSTDDSAGKTQQTRSPGFGHLPRGVALTDVDYFVADDTCQFLFIVR